MKKSDVFIGTVKKCNNIYWYERRGEKYFEEEFIIGHTHCGRIREYVDVISDKAILVKVSEDEYVYLDLVESLIDKILINLSIAPHIIKTKPHSNYDYFVDKSTLEPYFKENINDNINIKTLKKSFSNFDK